MGEHHLVIRLPLKNVFWGGELSDIREWAKLGGKSCKEKEAISVEIWNEMLHRAQLISPPLPHFNLY